MSKIIGYNVIQIAESSLSVKEMKVILNMLRLRVS